MAEILLFNSVFYDGVTPVSVLTLKPPLKVIGVLPLKPHVVATTHRNGTCSILTSAKLSVGYLVVGITRELNKEPSLHCSSIYINYMWSILQQY